MARFKTRIRQAARERGGLILANDPAGQRTGQRALYNIERLHPYLCAVKTNLHVLLPLGRDVIIKMNKTAHRCKLQSIADIKLNDITNTNRAALENLHTMGFDAVIANPIMGKDALKKLVLLAHKKEMGVISLCHMSAPEAISSYELKVGRRHLYQIFLEWAIACGADGIISGATYPDIIRRCKRRAGGRLDIYSPGVGAQGGSAAETLAAGSDYLIVGRAITESSNPVKAASQMRSVFI